MSDQNGQKVEGHTVKVFEFAKEIGIETLALMDKIREWKLPVRSHMADLDQAMMEEIRVKLQGPVEAEEPAVQTTKKAAKKASASEDSAKTGAKKTAAKPRAKAATKAAAKAGAAAEEKTGTANKKTAVRKKAATKVVVRRKGSEPESSEETGHLEAHKLTTEALEQQGIQEQELSGVDEKLTRENESHVEDISSAASEETPISSLDESRDAVLTDEATLTPETDTTEAVGAAADESKKTSDETEAASIPAPTRKREVVMTATGPHSGIRSEPRRNIIGRMDLSRVQSPQSGRPQRGPGGFQGGGPSSQHGPGGFGGNHGGGSARPLRAGFVAAPTMPTMEPNFNYNDQFDKKKFDAKREKKVGSAGAGGREEEVQAFSSTEFRKREMVFQPKKKKGMLTRVGLQTQITMPKASKRVVKVNQVMKVSDLAQEMGIKAAQLTKTLMSQGVMATMATDLDFDTIALIVPEFGFEAQNVFKSVEELIDATAFGDLEAESTTRPPVVTIMGHVDHGKTSLLDAIRSAKVAAGEAGGITQHIGAYQVTTAKGRVITFIDTPGHEAFTAMRARGANVTDIVVIVVAADDGVMPQTAEAINHAKAAGVPIIVAINKMDKPAANPDRIKQQMTEFELVPEEWGGTTIYVPVSALKKTGIPELLDQLALVAEVEELKANPDRSATGVVIESRMDKGRGPVATLLIQDGTLKVGQSVVVGAVPGRVRSLINDQGKRVNEAGPSCPVEILGLDAVPNAGDRFDSVQSDDDAAKIANARREKTLAETVGTKVSMEAIFDRLKANAAKEFPIVLKTDVAGSSEAIKGMFDKLSTDEVKIKIVHSAVGGISESDVLLASTASGVVVGFNVRPDSGAQAEAKRLGVEIRTYGIVYELMDDMKKALSGLLSPESKETQLGRAEVRNIFHAPKVGTIAGCSVVDGKIIRSAQVRLVRDGTVVYTGKLGSLKRFKDDAKEVAQGYECGMSIENFNDIKAGDVIEAFQIETFAREL